MARGWRGPLLAALVVLVAALPGALRIPVLDRDEARFAQATTQMLETGDYVNIRFQDAPRDKKPVGIHWLQAISVKLVSSVEKREIWAYRLPSLAGAMLAAAACAWGAAAALGPRGGLVAGSILGASFLLSSEGIVAKTDAMLCGAVALSMAALFRLYLASRDGPPAPRWTRLLFWSGQALAVAVKGPIGPMVAVLAVFALWGADRKAGWLKRLGWVWGPVLVLAVIGPWAMAITVATDGRFWAEAVGGDLAPKLAGAHESHGAPPGLHLLLSPLLFFPACVLLPATLVWGWRNRAEPFARFALAWLIPAWLVFEIAPTKLVHYPLPLYGALAWLAAGALTTPMGVWSRRLGAVLSLLAGGVFAAACLWAAAEYGGGAAKAWGLVCAVLILAAGAAGALGAWRNHMRAGLAAAGALGVAGHAVLGGAVLPSLDALWVSDRAAAALAREGVNPRDGLTPGPVAVAGYAEPSIVFALGAETELKGAAEAVSALADGRPALVESRQAAAFREAAQAAGLAAERVGEVRGFDYSEGDPVALSLWRAAPGAGADSEAPEPPSRAPGVAADPPAPPTPPG
ncbi:MAG: 4-amino-4-deoxy-L-arabinose transferase [Caulobacterales bacterium 32-69-10]|nr:MAG: 4-amino-4-deoxy-L-arabinose transferase [Caulobacterales bacterium 32-69-10]